MFDMNHHPVLVVMTIGAAAPLLAEIPKGFRVPTVVVELGLVNAGGMRLKLPTNIPAASFWLERFKQWAI